jgi:translation elongation factor EF-Tu-like GTPase
MVSGRMSVFIEAMLLLLPPDAGGRHSPVAPREGSYRPFVRIDDSTSRVRLLEGPPLLVPGDEARVMLEVETESAIVRSGAEYQLLEHDEQVVGILTVLRVCGRVLSV